MPLGIDSVVGAGFYLYSIVGAVNPHMVRPPTCLWASIVLWALGFIVPGEHGDTTHMPLGIKQYLQVSMSTIPEEGKHNLPHASDILQYINSVVGAYHYLVPAGVGNKAR